MTAKEKEEIKSRLERADYLERTLEIATDALTAINNPNLESRNSTEALARNVWYALRAMPKEYRDAIADVVKKWGESVNEEYKKL